MRPGGEEVVGSDYDFYRINIYNTFVKTSPLDLRSNNQEWGVSAHV